MLSTARDSGFLEVKRSFGMAIGAIETTVHVSLGGYVASSSSVKL